jgi:hypothetical protein
MRPIACPQRDTAPHAAKPRLTRQSPALRQRENPALRRGPSRKKKFQLALLAALATLLVAAVRVLLLLLTWPALSTLLRIALLLLTRLAVRIVLVLRILVRIGHCGSLHCGVPYRTNALPRTTFLRYFGSIVPEQLTGTRAPNTP